MSDAYLKTAAKQFSQAVQPYELEVDHVTYDPGDKIEVTVIASPTLSNEEKYTFDITKRNPEELAWGGDHDTFQLRIDLTAGSSTSPEVKSAILKAFKDVQHKNWNNDGQDWNNATKNNIVVETSKFVLDRFGIPDSAVEIAFNFSGTSPKDLGIGFESTEVWPDIQFQIGSGVGINNDETLLIDDSDGNNITSQDVSSKTGGDVITVSGVDLSANTLYAAYLSSSSTRTYENDDPQDYPYTSSDGDLEVTHGYNEGLSTGNTPFMLSKVGNIDL